MWRRGHHILWARKLPPNRLHEVFAARPSSTGRIPPAAFAPFGPVLGNVGLQPGAELVAKGEVFRSEVQIHFFLRSFVFTAQRGLVVSRSLLRRSLRRTTPRL